jgi:hypothetical protein
LEGFFDHGGMDLFLMDAEANEEGIVAENIDFSGYALGILPYEPVGVLAE